MAIPPDNATLTEKISPKHNFTHRLQSVNFFTFQRNKKIKKGNARHHVFLFPDNKTPIMGQGYIMSISRPYLSEHLKSDCSPLGVHRFPTGAGVGGVVQNPDRQGAPRPKKD
jgi:hypothetical protein